ncbi:MAG: integrase family protein [Deltaproteobacteria bacterium]|nr:integrase family protein [Deltaproteobacteria bacterium]
MRRPGFSSENGALPVSRHGDTLASCVPNCVPGGPVARFKFTEKSLAALPLPTADREYYWDSTEGAPPGFGVVVSKTGRKTFVVRTRNAVGRLVKETIGAFGQPRPDGHAWTVRLAREAAFTRFVAIGQRQESVELAPPPTGPTLRAALEYYIGKMVRGENRRGRACSPRSIKTTRTSIELHLADWLDRPLVELTADAIEDVMNRIERATSRRADANPENPPGRAEANRVLSKVNSIWRAWNKRHGLPIANPTERLDQRALKPRDTRVANDELPRWYATVMRITNSVRRDLQLVAMFSAIRSDGVRSLAWDDVDFTDEVVHVRKAKGDKPYAIPMTATLREIFERRLEENKAAMAEHGGDHGFVFPSLSRDMKRVQAVAEVKERRVVRDADGCTLRDEKGDYVVANVVPGIHVSRRTRNSIAIEIGCPQEIRERLLNHEGRGVNMRHYGRPHDWSLAADWAARIDAAIWQRIRGELPIKRSRLRAAPR